MTERGHTPHTCNSQERSLTSQTHKTRVHSQRACNAVPRRYVKRECSLSLSHTHCQKNRVARNLFFSICASHSLSADEKNCCSTRIAHLKHQQHTHIRAFRVSAWQKTATCSESEQQTNSARATFAALQVCVTDAMSQLALTSKKMSKGKRQSNFSLSKKINKKLKKKNL
jgi:hypothetical protein